MAELAVPEVGKGIELGINSTLPESRKQETSFPASFDTSSHTDVSRSKMEKVSSKEMRWERVIVASQDVASKVVRAFVVLHTHTRGQHTICCPYLSVLAESGKHKFDLAEILLAVQEH